MAIPRTDTDADRRRRERMVRDQLDECGDPRVLAAMTDLPRHWFVPEEGQGSAYGDHPAAIGAQQTISQPRVVAFMLEQLRVEPGMTVLDVGSGSGYTAALLARLVGPTGTVVAVERHRSLEAASREILDLCTGRGDAAAVILRHGDAGAGVPERAPYDRIHIGCGCERLPEALLIQLAAPGRMIAPVGTQGEGQVLRLVLRDAAGTLSDSGLWPVRFVPLLDGTVP